MTHFPPQLTDLAEAVLNEALARGHTIATAESCTGGLIAGCLTEIPGASRVFERGFIVYSNPSKVEELGIARSLIETHGAVSAEAAQAMADGGLAHSAASLCVSATGIAGPGGATPVKPAGLVYIGVANRRTGKTICIKNLFQGDRRQVRLETVETALHALREEIARDNV